MFDRNPYKHLFELLHYIAGSHKTSAGALRGRYTRTFDQRYIDTLLAELVKPRPTIVCLCGSTRFWRTFQEASLRETLDGKIVLSIGAASGTDDEHFGNLSRSEYDRLKADLDELHKRKIDLADEVLILNVGGYIGESTRSELNYALALGRRIRYWEDPTP